MYSCTKRSRRFNISAACALASLVLGLVLTTSTSVQAQSVYNNVAGQSSIPPSVEEEVEVVADDGTVRRERRQVQVDRTDHGNASGSQFDLARDGAFEGETVAVIHLYRGFDFSLPEAALREKGFSVYRWFGDAPPAAELREALSQACQLWIISDSDRHLTDEHLAVIREFWEQGHGLYIWGDNQPYYADANFVAEALFGARMDGNLPGTHNVGVQVEPGATAGVIRDHLITTGLEVVYEGVTITTVTPGELLRPLIYGSANNLVAAFYERDGRRAILDGGFTRLYNGWAMAGTGRYVKNAAAWLANYERFGDRLADASGETQAEE